MSCLYIAALWSSAGKGLISMMPCVLCSLVLCHFPKCVPVHMRIKGEVGAVKLVKALKYNILLTILLWIFLRFLLSYVCYALVRVCLYVPCGHPLGKG